MRVPSGLPRKRRRSRLCSREGVRVWVDPEADPADTDRLEFREGSRILGADEDVDRLGGDGVIDVGNPPQEVVRTTGQNDPSVRSCVNGCSAWLVSDPSRRLTPASAQSVPRLMAPACSVLELRRRQHS